jgi:hypothetical protein
MSLIKTTLIPDLVSAKKRATSDTDRQSHDDSALHRYVVEGILPYLATHAHLLQRSGFLTGVFPFIHL